MLAGARGLIFLKPGPEPSVYTCKYFLEFVVGIFR